MFARVTKYKMKPGSRDEATEMLNQLKGQIMSLDGVKNFVNMMNADGTGLVVSVVESEAQSNANAAKVASIWAGFADFLEAAPEAEGYDVIANWAN